MSATPHLEPVQDHVPASKKTSTLMHLPGPSRAWRLAGAGVLALALTASLATWPWNRADVPAAEAQEETAATDGIAATEADALAEAEASGTPVEVLGLRSETRDVFAQPDGSFIASEYTAPVRTMVDGIWENLDPTLEMTNDGRIVPKTVTSFLAFSAGGDEPLVTVAKNSHVLTMDWPGALPSPSIEGDTATYGEVLPGVDLRVTALLDGFTHTLVVKSAEAAANTALTSIEWPITLDGAALEATGEGGLAVLDSDTLDTWIAADSPVMWDSSGVAEAAEMHSYVAAMDLDNPAVALDAAAEFGRYSDVGISTSDSSIVLSPDQGLLTGVDTVYPVYIDPVYRDESRSTWAMVDSAHSGTSYWKWSGSQGVGGIDGHRKRVFYSVPTSAYKGKKIINAEFAVTVEYNWYWDSHATGFDIHLDKVSGFSSATTWNNKPTYTTIATADAPAPTNGGCTSPTDGATSAMEWDIDSTVQAAANAGNSALSFQVRNFSEEIEERWIRVCNNAQLRVHYNTLPTIPDTDSMRSSPGPSCKWEVEADSYVNRPPTLFATATDADHGDASGWGSSTSPVVEQLQIQFQLIWTVNGVEKSWLSAWSAKEASGSEFELNLETAANVPNLPPNIAIGWRARVTDDSGVNASEWSNNAPNQSRCRFVIDTTRPVAPTIASTDFPAVANGSEVIVPMVGEIGSLTVSTTDSDVVKYKVDFNKDTEGTKEVLATSGGALNLEFLPMVPGRHVLTVVALDGASNPSVSNTYSFRVSVAEPAAAWGLSEASGSTTAADATGTNPGTPGAGVEFGAGIRGSVAVPSFDGSANAYIATDTYAVAPTGAGVSISAWARVENLAKDGVVASIDGGIGEAGMILGYRSTSPTDGRWVLSMPDMAMNAFASWEVFGGQVTPTNQDEWVHLVGVWNDYTGNMTLYINGVAAGSGARQITWWGDGTVQIGRASVGGSWDDNFTGQISEVRIYDRVVPPNEAENLGYAIPERVGLWQFNDAGVNGSPEYRDGTPAQLFGGATLYRPVDEFIDPPALLNSPGHLDLDGVNSYAMVAGTLVDTSRSFSLHARVRLDTANPSNSMTVMSIAGANSSSVAVGYDSATKQWKLTLTKSDTVTAEAVPPVFGAKSPTADTGGQAITVVYNGTTGEIQLYVDGVASAPVKDPFFDSWKATGGLQIGRGLVNGAYTGYFAGAIDDVRAYQGALNAYEVQTLAGALIEKPEL